MCVEECMSLSMYYVQSSFIHMFRPNLGYNYFLYLKVAKAFPVSFYNVKTLNILLGDFFHC